MSVLRVLIFLAAAMLASPISAEVIPPHLPTCFELINKEGDSPPVSESMSVLIDQTVGFKPKEIDEIKRHITSWMTPGRELVIYSFSSNRGDQNIALVYRIRANPSADQSWKDWLKRSLREKYEHCEKEQPRESRRRAGYVVESILNKSDSSIPKSEILFSLQLASGMIRASNAKRKIVFLASDMLENSALLSFYQGGKLRKIDPESSLQAVKRNNLLADFGGAEVYIYGTGYLSTSGSSGVGLDRMKPLLDFWKKYFALSNSVPLEFGTPSLLGTVN